MLRKVVILAFGASLALSCRTSQNQSSDLSEASTLKTELGMNDVAILFPHTTLKGTMKVVPSPFHKPDPEKYAKGQSALPTDGEMFVPGYVLSELSRMLVSDIKQRRKEKEFGLGLEFTNIDETEEFLSEAPSAPENYLVTGLRIDPCSNFAELKKLSQECTHEVRVIYQHAGSNDERFNLGMNLHAIHTLDSQTFEQLVKALREIRAAAGPIEAEEALSPHPVMIKEGINGSYMRSVVGLMHRYLRASNLSVVSFHGLTGNLGHDPWWRHWSMAVVGVRNGKAFPIEAPSLKQKSGSKKLVQRFALPRDPRGSFSRSDNPWDTEVPFNVDGDEERMPSPLGLNATTLFPEFPSNTSDYSRLLEGAKIKYKNSFLIQNPMLHNRNNTDCASCHMSASQQNVAKKNLEYGFRGAELQKLLLPSSGAFSSKTRSLAPSRMKNGESEGTASPVLHSLQMFGYEGSSWVVTPHVVNDAAMSADLIKDF